MDVRIVLVTALFKLPQVSPPFIRIIRYLTGGEENILKLGVNWLYRHVEVKLGKGILLEAVPNELFYSFHRDEISVASLLHPCKIAFFPKGAELPSGISSFVCRRVYDIADKCLWWLTDQYYINERQEEVDKLLYKTRSEMHATVQPGGRSPKPMGGPTSTSQLKSGSDGVPNTNMSFPSQVKRKKLERTEHGSEPIKRERSLKTDDGDSGQSRPESILKSEIAKITDKGGLVNSEAVQKLVQLMLPEKAEKKIDLVGRSLLAGVVAATNKFDCLSRFVQLGGLSVLDEWLQEVHKGKAGDGCSSKDSDKYGEEFLLGLLRALDKLPVNLRALQLCNIGKSVNLLRSHKNLEIQKKARSLVDTWKKRVEAEMNINDAKPGSNQAVQWAARTRPPEISQGGNKHSGGSEVPMKSSVTHISASKMSSVKPVQGEVAAKSASAPPSSMKSVPTPAIVGASLKDGHARTSVGGGGSCDLPLSAARDEKSSSSSQSHNNSHSCSSEHTKKVAFSGKEDARSSTAGSMCVNKISRRKSISGLPGPVASGVQRESGSSRSSSLHRNTASEKLSLSGLTCEKKALDVPVADGQGHKLIVKIPNRGRSPAQSASGGSFEDPSILSSRASSPVLLEKRDQVDHNIKEKSDAYQANNTSDVNTESWQSNDFKDILTGSDEGDGSPAALPDEEHRRTGEEARKNSEVSKAASSSSGNELKAGKSQEASFSSMNALIESCVKYSESNASMSSGDEVGMNLLASVAAREMSKSDMVSPSGSPLTTLAVEDSCTGNISKSKSSRRDELALDQSHPNDHTEDIEMREVCTGASLAKGGDDKTSSILSEEKPAGERGDLQQSFVEPSKRLDESIAAASVAVSPVNTLGDEGGKQVHEMKEVGSEVNSDSDPNKSKTSGSLLAQDNISNVESKSDAVERLPSHPSLKADGENQSNVNEGYKSDTQIEQKLPALKMHSDLVNKSDEVPHPSGSGEALTPENVNKRKAQKGDDMDSQSRVIQNKKQRFDHKSECMEENLEGKEVLEQRSVVETSHKMLPAVPAQESDPGVGSRCSNLNSIEVGKTEECASTIADTSFFSAPVDGKLGFDLNEGFNADEGKCGEPRTAVHLLSPLPVSVSSVSIGLPASITVAAAAKGPFVPPDDLLRSRGEVGWKGSAATSAFRPAEPRKIPELQLPDVTATKQSRPLLDIDLNVPDERILEETAFQSSAPETGSTSGTIHSRNEFIGVTGVRPSGGLDLDLNQVGETADMSQYSMSNNRRLEVPLMPAKSSSGGFSGGRDFDLNNGPVLDEGSAEPSLFSQQTWSSMSSQPAVASLRVNNADMVNFSSWFPAGTTYPAVAIPTIMPERVEQPFPGGPQRILTTSTGGNPFGADVYRGAVLSSSPAMPFPSASFQYPVFPFGTNFPLPQPNLPGGSATYMDSSSGQRLCFPPVQPQLLGPPGAVSSNYPRPYFVSLSDGSTSGGMAESSRNWGRQGLDLNAGPGCVDLESRDDTLSFARRQLSVTGSQALAEEQARMHQAAGGGLKRKEPEGGWDNDRFSYKQSSWK